MARCPTAQPMDAMPKSAYAATDALGLAAATSRHPTVARPNCPVASSSATRAHTCVVAIVATANEITARVPRRGKTSATPPKPMVSQPKAGTPPITGAGRSSREAQRHVNEGDIAEEEIATQAPAAAITDDEHRVLDTPWHHIVGDVGADVLRNDCVGPEVGAAPAQPAPPPVERCRAPPIPSHGQKGIALTRGPR